MKPARPRPTRAGSPAFGAPSRRRARLGIAACVGALALCAVVVALCLDVAEAGRPAPWDASASPSSARDARPSASTRGGHAPAPSQTGAPLAHLSAEDAPPPPVAEPLATPTVRRALRGRVRDVHGAGVPALEVRMLEFRRPAHASDASSPALRGVHVGLRIVPTVLAVTNAAGEYTLPVPDADEVPGLESSFWRTLVVSGPGWSTSSSRSNIDDIVAATSDESASVPDIVVDSEVVVSGRLLDCQGAPWRGAHVCRGEEPYSRTVVRPDMPFALPGVACTETDDEGRFVLGGLAPGSVTLRHAAPEAERDGRVLRTAIFAAGRHALGDVSVPACQSLRGRVRDESGRPVPGARVVIGSVQDGRSGGCGVSLQKARGADHRWMQEMSASYWHRATTTDARGLFEWNDLLHRPSHVGVLADGYETVVNKIPDDDTHALDIVLPQPARLVLHVVDAADGRTLADARIMALRYDSQHDVDAALRVLSGPGAQAWGAPVPAGRSAIVGLGRFSNIVRVEADGYGHLDVLVMDVPPGVREERVVGLHPAARLTGRVVDDSGALVPDVAVTLTGAIGLRAPQWDPETIPVDGESGAIDIGSLAPGRWTLQTSATGYESRTLTFDLAPGAEHALGDIELPRVAHLRLDLRDHEGDRLDSDARAHALYLEEASQGDGGEGVLWKHHDRWFRDLADGTLAVELSAGMYRLSPGRSAHWDGPAPTFEVGPGETADLAVRLAPPAILRGSLADEHGAPRACTVQLASAKGSYRISSKGDGTFEARVGRGEWTVTTTASRGAESARAVIDVIAPGIHRVDLRLAPEPGVLRGRVVSLEDGTPLVGAKISGIASPNVRVVAESDADGRFHIEHVPAVDLRVDVRHGDRFGSFAITAPGEDDAELELRVPARVTLSGTLRRVDGGWMPAHVDVRLERLDDLPGETSSRTGRARAEHGRYAFERLPAARYRLFVDEPHEARSHPDDLLDPAAWGRDILVGALEVDLRAGGDFEIELPVRAALPGH